MRLGLSLAAALLLAGCDENVVCVSADGPVRTPEEARLAVRALRARTAKPVEVVFADGVYRLDRPLELTDEDGGRPGAPVVWRAKNRGKAVFTAATAIDWKPLADERVIALLPEAARGKVVVAEVPGTGPLPSFLNGSNYNSPSNDIPVEVFRGDERLTCARGPNAGFYETGRCRRIKPPDGRGWGSTGAFAFDRRKLAQWKREPFPWVFGLWGVYWADLKCPLDHLDVEGGEVFLDNPHYVTFGLKEEMPFYVFNAFSELDAPGEWVVDRARRRVYLWPGEEVEKRGGCEDAEVVLVEGLVRARGVSDVVFDGLVFEKSRQTAVGLKDCTNVTVRACCVRHTCAWGVKVEGGRNCRIAGCDLSDLGEGGVFLTGGDHLKLERADHVAENNHIHHYGKVFYNYRQGVSLNGVGCSAVHNLVHHSPHTGIYAIGNDHVIGWNVIHDTCEYNDDAGAIYVWNLSFVRRGVTVEHNVIHMTGKKRYPANTEGIYLDDQSSENVIRHNFINRASIGVNLGGGQSNEIYGNVILNCDRWMMLASRQPWPYAQKGRESEPFVEMDAHLGIYTSEKWLNRYPGLRRLLAVKDPVLAHHAYWNVISNNVYAFSGKMEKQCWEAVSNTTVLADNVDCGKGDPGLSDYFGFGWTATPGSACASVIDACQTKKAGLYDSAERLTPAVRFAADVTKPRPWGIAPTQPTARISCRLVGKLPKGEKAFACDAVGCTVPGWSQGTRTDKTSRCADDGSWRTVTCSFVPAFDCRFVLEVMGGMGTAAPLTEYGGVAVTGAAPAKDLFAKPMPFEANDTHRVVSNELSAKAGERVTVSYLFRAKE